MIQRKISKIVHLSAARYLPEDKSHPTYSIWQNLQAGFSSYHVLARSNGKPAYVKDGHLELHLIRSFFSRELEVLLTQFLFIPKAIRIKPDAIVSQNPALGGVAGVIIARNQGIPHMVEIHGAEFFPSSTRGLRGLIIQIISSWVYSRVDRIRVLSERMRKDFLQSHPAIAADRVVVLQPRVDLSIFVPKNHWSCEGPLNIIMVGNLNENKGQLRAIRTLTESGLPLRLWLVGDGPHMPLCQTEAEKAGGSLEVTLTGRLPPHEVAEHMRNADVFLMNSLTEGTPRAIMEAMSLGLPVITTDAGYCVDIVEDGRTGFVVARIGGEAELIRRLKELSTNPYLRRRMGEASIQRARREFDSVLNFARYRGLIDQMIEDGCDLVEK